MSQNPTILILGGAFQTTEFFEPLKLALEKLDYPVVLPTLPTCSDIDRVELGKTDPADDVRVAQAELEALVNQSKRVVVLFHSYACLVGGSLKVKDLTVSARKEKDLEGGLECLVWYGAVALPENVSFRQVAGGYIPDFDECMDDGTYNFLIAEDTFLEELSQEERKKWAAKVIPHTQKVFDYVIPDGAWKYVPNVTILTEKDKANNPEFQERCAKTVGSKKIVRLDMGHGAHLARPDELAKGISEGIRGIDA